MMAQVVNVGTAEECQAVIDQFRAAGIDALLLTPFSPPGDLTATYRTMETLAPK